MKIGFPYILLILSFYGISQKFEYQGQIKEEINQNDGFYRLFYKNGKIKLLREGDFRYCNHLKKGTESLFDENGELIEAINIDSKQIETNADTKINCIKNAAYLERSTNI